MTLPQTVNSAVPDNTKFERNSLGATAVARSTEMFDQQIERCSAACWNIRQGGILVTAILCFVVVF